MVRFVHLVMLACGLLWLAMGPSLAQQSPDDLLLQFQQRLQSGSYDPSQSSAYGQGQQGQQEPQTQQGPQSNQQGTQNQFRRPEPPPSAIEQSYRDRLKELFYNPDSNGETQLAPNSPLAQSLRKEPWQILRQVGYDVLSQQKGQGGNGVQANGPQYNGGISDGYILGIGDKMTVTLRGQANVTQQVVVDRNGQVILPNLPPIDAAGHSFGEFRVALENQVAASMIETQAFVSLAAVRQLSILVSGEVEKPGLVSVNGLSSLIDALIAADGIRKTGSLRRVQVVRDGETTTVDLYPVLLGIGTAPDLSIREGDRIVVPPIGATIAIYTGVSRPGIYELAGGSASFRQALNLAGGPLTAKGQRLVHIARGTDGRTTINEFSSANQGRMGRGDIIGVLPAAQGTSGTFHMSGHVLSTGWRSLSSIPTVGAMLAQKGLLDQTPYLPFIVIKRQSPTTLSSEFIAVDGSRILRTGQDVALQDQDRVIILSQDDIGYLNSLDMHNVVSGVMPAYGRVESPSSRETTLYDNSERNTQQPRQNSVVRQNDSAHLQATMEVCKGLRRLSDRVAQQGPIAFYSTATADQELRNVAVCPKIYDDEPELLSFLTYNLMSLQGAVYRPGFYPVTDLSYLGDIIQSAGGVLYNANPQKVEVTLVQQGTALRQDIALGLAQSDYVITPGSSVRIGARFSNAEGGIVEIKGQVRYPGRYTLLRGERLSQLIVRAGGYTDEAYSLGAVFTRESVRKQEEQTYRRLAQEMESGIPAAIQTMATVQDSQQQPVLAALQQAVLTLRNAKASGRMVIDANPASIERSPEADILLHNGDMLYVPPRPSHVMVSGEVMYSGAQRFESGLSAEEYIQRAGGMGDNADESRIFVVLPDGSAKPLSVSYWNYQESQIPPGSTIVVPRDLTPLVYWGLARDALSVFSNIAISAAALASIDD